jgi:hypothetical protein
MHMPAKNRRDEAVKLRSLIDKAPPVQREVLASMARIIGKTEVARIEGILTRLPGSTPSVRPPEVHGPPPEGERRHFLNLRRLIDSTSEPFPNAALKFMARELGKPKIIEGQPRSNIEGLRQMDERIPRIIS